MSLTLKLSVAEAKRAEDEARKSLRYVQDGRYAPAVVEMCRQHVARAHNARIAAEKAARAVQRGRSWPFHVVGTGGKVLVTPSKTSGIPDSEPTSR